MMVMILLFSPPPRCRNPCINIHFNEIHSHSGDSLSISRRQRRNYKKTRLIDTPRTRQSVANAATYYLTLDNNQVRLIMPPPPVEGGGGNHYNTSLIHL